MRLVLTFIFGLITTSVHAQVVMNQSGIVPGHLAIILGPNLIGDGGTVPIAGLASIATSGSASDLIAGLAPLARGGLNLDLTGTGGTSQFLKQNTLGGQPSFVRPACADLSNSSPSCSTDATNAGNLSAGLVPLARGGIHADLTATGGTSQFLKQNTVGGQPTFTRPACADLSDAGANCSNVFLLGATFASGFQNKLRGHTMTQWYNGFSTATITTAGGWASEGVYVIPVGASITVARAATPFAGSPHDALLITGAASVTDVKLRFVIESYDIAPLAGVQVIFQIAIANATGSTKTPTLAAKFPTAQDNWAASTQDLAAVNLQPITNGGGTILSYSWTLSASAINGYELIVDLGPIINGQTMTVAGGYDLRQVQLGAPVAPGLVSSPPIPEIRTTESDEAWCKKFREGNYDNGTPVATVTTNGADSMIANPGVTSMAKAVSYKVSKRAIATPTMYSPTTGASGKVRDNVTAADVTPTIANVGLNGFRWSFSSGGASMNSDGYWFTDVSLTGN